MPVWVLSISHSHPCLRLLHTHAVRKIRSPGSSPVFFFWLFFTRVTGIGVCTGAGLFGCYRSGIGHSLYTASSSHQGLVTLHNMIRSGSCTLIVAPKQSELEAALHPPQMLSKETVAKQFAQSSRCGMQWRMFLGKLRVLPNFMGVETGCGKGWCASQRTCLLFPSPLCWIPLLSPPSPPI